MRKGREGGEGSGRGAAGAAKPRDRPEAAGSEGTDTRAHREPQQPRNEDILTSWHHTSTHIVSETPHLSVDWLGSRSKDRDSDQDREGIWNKIRIVVGVELAIAIAIDIVR